MLATPLQRLMRAILACAMCAPCLCARAQPREFTVGVENLNYYPLHTTVHGTEYGGYARDVLDAFAQENGYTFRYVPMPINRLTTVFRTGDTLDFKYPDNPNWQPAGRNGIRIVYSAPLVMSEEGAMVLPAHVGRPLRHMKTLGTVLGFTPAPFFPALEARSLSLSTAPGFDSLLRHALAGHLDGVYINVDVGNYLLAEQLKAPGGLVFDPGLPHVRSDFSLSTRKHLDVIARFDLFLQNQRPLLQQLRAKYRIADAAPP